MSRTVSKMMAITAALACGGAWAIDGVTTATYSLDVNQANHVASALLGGAPLPNATQWVSEFGDFVAIRESETNKAAILSAGHCPWNTTDLSAVGSSVLIVAKLSTTENGILFTFGSTAANSYALIQRSDSKVALVKSNSNGTNLLEADLTDGATRFHAFVLTAEATEDDKFKYTLFIDGEQKAETTVDAALFAAGYQFGTTPQGTNPSGITTGTGIQIDEFGAWTEHVLTAEENTAIAAAYPLWPDAAAVTVVSTEVTYDDVKDAVSIQVESTGVINIGNAFAGNKDGLTAFLRKITGTGKLMVSGLIPGPFPTAAFKATGCTVKMAGVTTWIQAGATVDLDLELENVAGETPASALVINGANSGSTYTFSGRITGSGDLEYSQTDVRTCTFALTGDVSGWTGSFINRNTGAKVKVASTVDPSRVILPEDRIVGTKTESGMTTYLTRSTTATEVYAREVSLTQFYNTDGFKWNSIVAGDVIVIATPTYTGDKWGVRGDNFPADHTIRLGMEMNVKNGIPADRTVEANAAVYLYGDIGTGTTISGTGMLDCGYTGGATTIGSGSVISVNTLKVLENRTIYIDGSVTITSPTLNLASPITLKANASLTTAGQFADNQVAAVDGYRVEKTGDVYTAVAIPVGLDPTDPESTITVTAGTAEEAIAAVAVVAPADVDAAVYKTYFTYGATAAGEGQFTVVVTGIDQTVVKSAEAALTALQSEADEEGYVSIETKAGLFYSVGVGDTLTITTGAWTAGGEAIKVAKPAGTKGFIKICVAPTATAE